MHQPESQMRWAIAVTWFFAACGGAPQPVEIAWNEEVCDQCRMAISQPEFAAEIVTREGAVHYFDDIGCMARWTVENESPGPPEDTGWFATDYDTHSWLDARSGYYVHSDRLPTPMNHGLAAFRTREQAQAAANRLEGEVIDWKRVLEGDT